MKRSLALILAAGMVTGGASMGTAHAASKGMMSNTFKINPLGGSMAKGMATFMYDAKTKMTTVKVVVTHLKPMSTHPAHIHAGRCGGNGAIVHPLGQLHANGKGVAMSTTKFMGNYEHKMWYVNVHMGPSLMGKGATPIACGNVM